MKDSFHIAILGGGGKTGTFLVKAALEGGYRPRVLLRKPVSQFSLPAEDVVSGNALNIDCLREVVRGCRALVSTIGQRPGEPLVAGRLMDLLLEVLPDAGIRRYVALAGVNVDAPGDQKGPSTLAASAWMRDNFPAIHKDRQAGCDTLFESALDWTLVRVPLINFSPDRGSLSVGLEDCPGNTVQALDLVEFMLAQIDDDTYIGKSPFIATTEE